jgi:hypothetical protein
MLILEFRQLLPQRPRLRLHLRPILVAFLPPFLLPLFGFSLLAHQKRSVSFESIHSGRRFLELELEGRLGRAGFEGTAFKRVLELVDFMQGTG